MAPIGDGSASEAGMGAGGAALAMFVGEKVH